MLTFIYITSATIVSFFQTHKFENYQPNIKRYERNASQSQSNAGKVTEIIKYK